MDQAELLTIIGGLYDKLVNDVANKVQARLQEGEHWNNVLDAWAANSLVLEDKVDSRIQSVVDTLDLDDPVRNALDNVGLDDMVVDAVRELDFTVSVSR